MNVENFNKRTAGMTDDCLLSDYQIVEMFKTDFIKLNKMRFDSRFPNGGNVFNRRMTRLGDIRQTIKTWG